MSYLNQFNHNKLAFDFLKVYDIQVELIWTVSSVGRATDS